MFTNDCFPRFVRLQKLFRLQSVIFRRDDSFGWKCWRLRLSNNNLFINNFILSFYLITHPHPLFPKIILIIRAIPNILHQWSRIKNMPITQFGNISLRLIINTCIFPTFRTRSHTLIIIINTLRVVVDFWLHWVLIGFYWVYWIYWVYWGFLEC